MELLKTRHGQITAVIIGLLVAFAITWIVERSTAAPAPTQQVHVSIRGNLGGYVSVDGGPNIRLGAYDGTDTYDGTAHTSVIVTVESTGDAPWCHVINATGQRLADDTGSTPHTVPQTMSAGYGPASVTDAPTIETAICEAKLSR